MLAEIGIYCGSGLFVGACIHLGAMWLWWDEPDFEVDHAKCYAITFCCIFLWPVVLFLLALLAFSELFKEDDNRWS